MQQSLPLDQRYMLTLKEAAAYFGIGQKKMHLLATLDEGNFTMRNGNRYLICRPAFEKYLEGLMKNEEEELETAEE
jgi:hypothetical protein